MIDPRLSIPTLEADFEAVVDSIRKTGTITDSVVNGSTTLLTTDNADGFLKKDQVLLIDGKDCRINEATDTTIIVNQVVGGATSWKALFPYFMDGHVEEVAERLSEKDKSNNNVIMYTKYPLVILIQNIKYRIHSVKSNEANVAFLIVNGTNAGYITVTRRENNFNPIIDPIYNELIGALKNSSTFRIDNEYFGVSREFYWGSEFADKNPLNDRLDSISVENLNLILTTPKC
jgi:hypothetical protein